MLFILKNHPFYEQYAKETMNINPTKRNIKNLESLLKKRYEKSQTFNPDDCYTEGENSRDESTANSELYTKSPTKIKDKSTETIKRKSLDSANNLNSISKKKNRVREKISLYKSLIKVFDVLAVLLIITGAIISQYEQELYYQSNLIYRIPAVKMKEYISANPTNHTLSLIFDEANVDLNSLTNFNLAQKLFFVWGSIRKLVILTVDTFFRTVKIII